MIFESKFWGFPCSLALTALACGAGVDRAGRANSALVASADAGVACTDTSCSTCSAESVSAADTIEAELAAPAATIAIGERISSDPIGAETKPAPLFKSPPGTTARCDEIYQQGQKECKDSTGSACNNTAGYNLPYLGCLCCSKAAADNAFCYCIANGGAFAACFAVQCKDYTASYTKCFSF